MLLTLSLQNFQVLLRKANFPLVSAPVEALVKAREVSPTLKLGGIGAVKEGIHVMPARLWKPTYARWPFERPGLGPGFPDGIQLTMRCTLPV